MNNANKIFTIDAGNTNLSILEWTNQVPNDSTLSNIEKNSTVIVSNVGSVLKKIPTNAIYINQRSNSCFGNMPSQYKNQAGIDRLLFAYHNYQKIIDGPFKKKFLLIDSGTFITMDILTNKGFQGGVILPGTKLLNESFNTGANLNAPQVINSSSEQFPYTSTLTTLNNASSFYIESITRNVLNLCSDIDKIIITGGGSRKFKDSLHNLNLEIEVQDDAVHFGLFHYFLNEFGHKEMIMK